MTARIAETQQGLQRASVTALSCGVVLLAGIAGCSTLDVAKVHEEPPLFQQINARVGKTFTADARIADTKDVLARAEIGKISVGRFDQAFDAMFSETAELPLWPPWQKTDLGGFDGVIQLEDADAKITLGDDFSTPDNVNVHYRTCLYETDLTPVGCWSADATQSYQRKPFECLLGWNSCMAQLLETAVRDAVAIIMAQIERDAAVEAWASGLGRAERSR